MVKKTIVLPAFLAITLLGITQPAGTAEESIRFGVVADVQYHSGESQGNRYYAASLDKLRDAVTRFNEEELRFIVNLGDTIETKFQNFDAVMPLFKMSDAPVYHLIGNHDFNVDEEEAEKVQPLLGLNQSYFAFSKGNWVFIMLNGFELRFPHPENEALKKEAEDLYARLSEGAKEPPRPWNGGIGSVQLGFLEDQLKRAHESGKNAIVICHFPVLPESPGNLWNDAEVVAVLEKHPAVKAYFGGHNHEGAYVFQNGIHYLTFKAMVDTPDQNAFAIVSLEKDVIRVEGFGREPSRILELRPR